MNLRNQLELRLGQPAVQSKENVCLYKISDPVFAFQWRLIRYRNPSDFYAISTDVANPENKSFTVMFAELP